VIDEANMCGLLLELKWFIAPAEVREVLDRSEDLQKGVQQARLLATEAAQHPSIVRRALRVPPEYRLVAAVVSKTWIGNCLVQDPNIPIIRGEDLIQKLVRTRSLPDTLEWLGGREYLPLEGRDYQVAATHNQLAGWHLEWYGVRPLLSHAFDPAA
jgi:hypothetical protein